VFQVVRTTDLAPVQRVVLKGNFAFDALSPDGSRLYLIQRVSQQNLSRYVVRAYSLDRRRLLPGRIADRTQRGWVMAGYPLTRATSADGRWVYTLYARPDGYPFVHALDTVRGVAHCIGIPWQGNQNALWRLRMSVRDGGRPRRGAGAAAEALAPRRGERAAPRRAPRRGSPPRRAAAGAAEGRRSRRRSRGRGRSGRAGRTGARSAARRAGSTGCRA